MNNPVQFVQMMRNPQQLMQYMMNNTQAMQNPIAKNAMEMYQNGDIEGIKAMAENLAIERHTTVDEVKKSLLSQFGM